MTFLTSLVWAAVGLLVGLVAGVTAGYRHKTFRPPPVTTDVVVHRYVNGMRASAASN